MLRANDVSQRSTRIRLAFGALAFVLLLAAALLFAAHRASRAPARTSAKSETPDSPGLANPPVERADTSESQPPISPESSAPEPTVAAREIAARDSAPRDTERASVSARVVDAAGTPITGVRVLASFGIDADSFSRPWNVRAFGQWFDARFARGTDARSARAIDPLWKRRLPLDLADPRALDIEPARTTDTDADGRFTFDHCPPGRFRLSLRSAQAAPRDFDDLILPAESALVLPDIELEPGAAYSGFVIDARQRPLEGARLASIDDFLDPTLPDLSALVAPEVARSGRNGSYATRMVPLGRARFVVRAPSLAPLSADDPPEVRVDTTTFLAGSDELLSVAFPPGSHIVGHVASRAVDRGSLAVAAIRASAERTPMTAACRADYRTARVEPNGTFVLTGVIEDAAYELCAISLTQSFDDDCPWSPPVIAIAGRDEDVALEYRPDCSLAFVVEDARTHTPVSRYTVTLRGATPDVLRDEHGDPIDRHDGGRTQIRGVRPTRRDARVAIEISADGSAPIVREERLVSETDMDLGAILVDRYPTVAVTVRSAGTNSSGIVRSARPNSNGLVRSTSADSGVARNASPDSNDLAHSASTSADGLVHGTTSATSDVDLGAHGGPSLAGVRLLSIERDPVTNDESVVDDRITDAHGGARIASLATKSSTLLALCRGFAPLRIHGADIGGANGSCTIDLESGATANVRVIDSGGAPIGGAEVEHVLGEWTPNDRAFAGESAIPGPDAVITNAQGVCTFTDLEPGRHTFRVARARGWLDSEWKIVGLDRSAPTEVVLVTNAFANVDGRVLDGKRPVAGARIAACRADLLPLTAPFVEPDRPLLESTTATSDSRGHFSLRNLEPGPYRLIVAIEGQDLRIARDLRVEPGDRTFNIDVGDGVIRGVVEAAGGGPCRYARIWVMSRADLDALEAWQRRLQRGAATFDASYVQRGFPPGFEHPAVVADARGAFVLRGLARNESYALFASDGATEAGWKDLSATRRSRDERALVIRLAARGWLRVAADSATGKRALVLVALRTDAPARIENLRPGLDLVLPALDVGTWSVQLFEKRGDGGYVPIVDPREVEITAGAEATADFVLP